MAGHRVFAMKFSRVYPLYVQKAQRKHRTKEEVDEIIRWLTGYTQAGLHKQLDKDHDIETFFAQAPAFNPNASLIKAFTNNKPLNESVGHPEESVPFNVIVFEVAHPR